MTLQEFFNAHGQHAANSSKKYGLNPALILAVSSWETAYGTSYAYKNDRNCFGIKSGAKSPHWDGVSKRATSDGGYYRKYADRQDSFYDFGWLITSISRYAPIRNLSYDPKAFADGFIVSGYMGGTQQQRNNYRDAIIDRTAKFALLYGNQPVQQQPDIPGFFIVVALAVIAYYFLNRSSRND